MIVKSYLQVKNFLHQQSGRISRNSLLIWLIVLTICYLCQETCGIADNQNSLFSMRSKRETELMEKVETEDILDIDYVTASETMHDNEESMGLRGLFSHFLDFIQLGIDTVTNWFSYSDSNIETDVKNDFP